MIYLDNSSTTKPYAEVMNTFTKASIDYFGNPSSLHNQGSKSEQLIREARRSIAKQLSIFPQEIVFTSGGSEGNNLAIKGAAFTRQDRGKHLITTAIEHPSVLETFQYLESLGFTVTYLPVNREGLVSVQSVMDAITEETILVSIMHVNHETGAVQPIEAIGQKLKDIEKIRFHVDHVQGFLKVPLNFHTAGIDLCTISGHKIHSVKGSGFLFVRDTVTLVPLIHGGGQEFGVRSGTENVPAIAALTKAIRLSLMKRDEQLQHVQTLKTFLMEQLRQRMGMHLNTPNEPSAPHIVNVSIDGTKPEVLIQALSKQSIYVSSKSACSSKQKSASAVLYEQFQDLTRASTALRMSLSYETTRSEIVTFLEALDEMVAEVRTIKEVKL
ncbi:cysteine desulfurase family protein [Geomicrobium sp. JCM 19038]|uniref:cysteine desulfurase family protein n=1 Tax=Geomicrobium sp. JCM 19038 TaxID=1460635 RepID=UPI00045F2167|nr:cysteine desulfurase family protein [Geomicrobium sp. JCM 19038]GAK09662.1 cysteine desulfurase [Geomicrobium sp. JCM 19038]